MQAWYWFALNQGTDSIVRENSQSSVGPGSLLWSSSRKQAAAAAAGQPDSLHFEFWVQIASNVYSNFGTIKQRISWYRTRLLAILDNSSNILLALAICAIRTICTILRAILVVYMQYMYFIVHNIGHNIDSKIDVQYCMQYSVLLLLAIFVKDIVHIVHIEHIANASKILLLLSSIASFIAMVLIADGTLVLWYQAYIILPVSRSSLNRLGV